MTEFAKLTMEEYFALDREAYTVMRGRLVDDLDAAGITDPTTRLKALREFQDRHESALIVVRYAMTTEGVQRVLEMSWARCGGGKPMPVLDRIAALKTACDLCEIRLDLSADADDDEEEVHGDRPTGAAIAATG